MWMSETPRAIAKPAFGRTGALICLGLVSVASSARAQDASATPAPPPAAQPSDASPAPAAAATPAPAPPTAGSKTEVAIENTAPAAAPGEDSYNIKLRNIEERVNQLKERIFQSKARLMQLQEVVLHGRITGAKAILIHQNEMGSSFRLLRVQYALDGAPIFNRIDSGGGELNDEREIELFNGGIAPGNHQISVYLEYQGHGYGVFSYLKGYKFKIKSSYAFTAEEGKLTTVRNVGYEQGGITTQHKDRPAVDYRVEVSRDLRPEDDATKNGP
jgi:hypothetical protein